MSKTVHIKLLDDLDWNINDRKYHKGEEFEVVEFDYVSGGLSKSYARYYDDALDFIPKQYADVIEYKEDFH